MNIAPHQHSSNPLAWLSIAFIAGVLTAQVFPISLSVLWIVSTGLIGLCVVAIWTRRLVICTFLVLIMMAFAGMAANLSEHKNPNTEELQRLIETNPGAVFQVRGYVETPLEFSRFGIYFSVRLEEVWLEDREVPASGLVSFFAPIHDRNAEGQYRSLDVRYGSQVRIKSVLNRRDKYRNPGGSQLTEFLELKGLDAMGVVKNARQISVLETPRSYNPLRFLYEWREMLQREIDAKFSAETAGVLDAALLGNRHNLSKSTADRFRDGGTFHILVISGLHISFLGGIALLIARRLTGRRWAQFLISTVVVWSYSFGVGAESSVLRSALMFTFVLLATVVFRTASSLNALGGAAILLLVLNTKEVHDPSWQLTFLSVFAIVAVAWPVLRTCSEIGRWQLTRSTPYPPRCARVLKFFCEVLFWSQNAWIAAAAPSAHRYRLRKSPLAVKLERWHLQTSIRYLFSAVVVSVAVQLVLLPFQIVYFHRVSFASLLLNIIVSFLLALLAFVALIALVLSQLSLSFAGPLISLADLINWLMIHSVDPFSRLGLHSIRLPEFSGKLWLVYVSYYVPLLALLVGLNRWRPFLRPVGAPAEGRPYNQVVSKKTSWPIYSLVSSLQVLLVIVVLCPPFSARLDSDKLRVDFLDVGQGDSALVTMPDGTTMLVDGGGQPSFLNSKTSGDAELFERDSRSIGEAVVSEYLWWRGLDHIDYILVTHADADHIDGLNDVLRNFHVGLALVGRTPQSDAEYAKFRETLAATKTPVQLIQAGDVLNFGDVSMSVLWPQLSANEFAPSQNNDSVVVRLQLGHRSILLTGDIERAAETSLLESQQVAQTDVVKVAHHGSRTSSTEGFVQVTKPGLAIISVGRTSMFGHPHEEVVERWQKVGAEVLTTGKCGTITVTTDGAALAVEKFASCY